MRIETLAALRTRLAGADPTELAEAARDAFTRHQAAMNEIDRTAGNRELSATQQRQWDAHTAAADELDAFLNEYDRDERDARSQRVADSRRQYGGVEMDPATRGRNGRDVSVARRRADQHLVREVRSGLLTQVQADQLTRSMDGAYGSRNAREMAEWIAVAGDEDYYRAFARYVADPVRGHMLWTEEEAQAFRRVEQWRTEQRTALATSGVVLPIMLDSAVILINDGNINAWRQAARVVTIATNQWRGVSSTGATAEWKTEGSEAADGTPPEDEVTIDTFFADVNAIYSYEAEQDAPDLLAQLQALAADALNNLEAVAFATGGGSTAPQGIVTGLVAATNPVQTAAGSTLAKADIYTLQNALAPRYSAGASWHSALATINTIKQFETTSGAVAFPEMRELPPSLLGRPFFEESDMDATVSSTAHNYLMVYGNINRAYTIVDRIGNTAEVFPVFGASGRPKGQRQLFMTKRTGAAVTNSDAAVVLDVDTT